MASLKSKTGILPRRALKAIAPFWVLMVAVGSFLPLGIKLRLGTPLSFSRALLLGEVPTWHRAVHFALFGLTAAILVLIGRTRYQRLAALTGTVALGFLIELFQNFIDKFGIEWWDVRDDSLAAIAVYLLLLIQPIRHELVRD